MTFYAEKRPCTHRSSAQGQACGVFIITSKPFYTKLLTLIVQTRGKVCTKPLAELTVTLTCFHSLHPNKSAARTLLVREQWS